MWSDRGQLLKIGEVVMIWWEVKIDSYENENKEFTTTVDKTGTGTGTEDSISAGAKLWKNGEQQQGRSKRYEQEKGWP